MLRGPTYILLGCVLIALVGGLAEVFGVTVMLPATSAIVVTHVAFGRKTGAALGLAIAVAIGYFDDLQQGAPLGTLSLAHGVTFLVLRWASRRVHLPLWWLQALASFVGVIAMDLVTFGILLALPDSMGFRGDALFSALRMVPWHGLATLLATPPIWAFIDYVFERLRFDEVVPS